MEKARELLDEAGESLKGHPSMFHAGFLHDAQKEYAEGHLTLALAAERPLPDPDGLKIEYPAYLNGMGEAVGEMRRHILDTLRKGDVEQCERKLEYIDAIYTALTTIDFPDGITSGLRRTTDMARGVVERTRGDLTVAYRQHQLERSLQEMEERLRG